MIENIENIPVEKHNKSVRENFAHLFDHGDWAVGHRKVCGPSMESISQDAIQGVQFS